jgi:hypothetical protein
MIRNFPNWKFQTSMQSLLIYTTVFSTNEVKNLAIQTFFHPLLEYILSPASQGGLFNTCTSDFIYESSFIFLTASIRRYVDDIFASYFFSILCIK